MNGSVPPPGWYPDPSNDQQLRWWTGERWTGAARPLEDPSGPAGAPARPGPWLGDPAGGSTSADALGGASTPEAPEQEPHEALAMSERTAAMGSPTASGFAAEPEAGSSAWGVEVDDEPEVGDGWTRERIVAASVMGGLLVLSLAIWLFAVVLTGSGNGDASVASDPGTASDAETDGEGDAETGDEGGAEDTDEADGDAPSAEGDEPATAEDGAAATEDDAEGDDAEDGGTRTVEFDDLCTVEVEQDRSEDDGPLRPWQFDECTSAPIDLGGGDGRWIVVIASVDGELDADRAQEQAADRGSGYGLLWSGHYPSLNPGWWVVYDGPFSEEDAATDAADAAGGGAYPRLLSDDEDDRYCIAEDGC